MEENSGWDEANGQFMNFINETMGLSPDDKTIEQSGQMLSYFSNFIVSIEENKVPEFRYFFQLILKVDESIYSSVNKDKIISKLMEILRNVYPVFYARYNFFDL